MKYEKIRRIVLNAVEEARQLGLIHGTSGNIAMRDEKDPVIAITPSGLSYDGMTTDQIALVRVDTGEWFDGAYKPSSELPMHLEVFRNRPDVYATVHTHGKYSVLAAMQGEIRAVTPPHAEFVPCGYADFAVPGDVWGAKEVAKALGQHGRTVFLRNHGTFCCGKDMPAAMEASIYSEEMAELNFLGKMAGCFVPLTDQEIQKLKVILEHYHVEK
jgi:ribulose-5-phosphate 4-epimerase/fuculose-1-phosphate aldolase